MRRLTVFLFVLVIFLGYGCAALKLEPPTIESKYFQDNNYPCYKVVFNDDIKYIEDVSGFGKKSYAKAYKFKDLTGVVIIGKYELTRTGYWTPKSVGDQTFDDVIIYEAEKGNKSGVVNIERLNSRHKIVLIVTKVISDRYFASIYKVYSYEYFGGGDTAKDKAEYVRNNPEEFNLKKIKNDLLFYMNHIKQVKCQDKGEG